MDSFLLLYIGKTITNEISFKLYFHFKGLPKFYHRYNTTQFGDLLIQHVHVGKDTWCLCKTPMFVLFTGSWLSLTMTNGSGY